LYWQLYSAAFPCSWWRIDDVLRQAVPPLQRALACAAAAFFVAGFSGCAAVKAARQPDKKNLGVLHEGTPRAQVIAELGAPTYTKPRPDGTVEDVFSFKQGYTKGVKMGRAFVHGAADVATGGLWEVIGIPTEIWADGTEVQVLVTYDQDERVRYRRVFKGQEAFKDGRGTVARQSKATKVASKPAPTTDDQTAADASPAEGDASKSSPSSSDVVPASL
jgi:outer membrane protein assembly factor BamE (lipoprotein component of BamABCDE complex)